jgi:hypothetical protein
MRCDVIASNTDAQALKNTINNYDMIINYLANNSINITYVSNTLSHYDIRKVKTLKISPDLSNLSVLNINTGSIIYFLRSNSNFSISD